VCSSLRPQLLEDTKLHGSPSKATTKAIHSPKKSPSKATLRTLPSKDSPHKRKVTFPQAEIEGDGYDDVDMDLLSPETPTKRRKLDSPSKFTLPVPTKANSSLLRNNSLQSTPSSSRVILGASEDQEEQLSHSSLSDPSTPRRSQRHSHLQNHTDLTKPRQKVTDAMGVDSNTNASASSDEEEEEDELLPPRRFRPVFLDHKQWYGRDPRLDRMWRRGEIHKRGVMELYEHPLEQYRAVANEEG